MSPSRAPTPVHPLAAPAALVVGAALALAVSADPEPSPDLPPAEVVRLQVEALRANDDPRPDAGIETAFRFASPSNRAATGPLPRFSAMVKAGYGDLLTAADAAYGEPVVDGDRAAQRVTLAQPDGRRTTYVFSLSRQRGGPYDGCWMTDGVARQELGRNGTTRA